MQKKRTQSSRTGKASEHKNKSQGTRGSRGKKNAPLQEAAAKDNTRRNYELAGLFLVAVCIIAFCGLSGLNVGFIGLRTAKFLQYFFGLGSIIAAVAIGALGVFYIMRHQRLLPNARVIGGVVFFACAMGMLHHFAVAAGSEILPESLPKGGGLLGGAIAFLLHSIVGTDGTPIILGVGMVAAVLVMTTWSLAQGILFTKEQAEKGAGAAKKVTITVRDKTVQAGEQVKEQVKEYVQERREALEEKRNQIKGREFLRRYEEDSAFLLSEAGQTATPKGTTHLGINADSMSQTAGDFFGVQAAYNNAAQKQENYSPVYGGDVDSASVAAQNKTAENPVHGVYVAPPPPVPASAEDLVESNPMVADFFGEQFSADVHKSELPSLAQQLGETPLKTSTAATSASGLENLPHNRENIAQSDEKSSEKAAAVFSEESDMPAWHLPDDTEDFSEYEAENNISFLTENHQGETIAGMQGEADEYGISSMAITYGQGNDAATITYTAGDESDDEDDIAIAEQDGLEALLEGDNDTFSYMRDLNGDEYDHDSYQDEAYADDIYYEDDVTASMTEGEDDNNGEIADEIAFLADNNVSQFAAGKIVEQTIPESADKGAEQAAEKVQEVPPPPPYELPPLHLLSKNAKVMSESLNQEIADKAKILGETLANFKVKASILNACHGPAVTRYEVKPAPGVKVSKITGLADDIALNMAASSVRIEQIPGKAAIGIEVPNQELESVQLREVLENPAFAAAKSRLTVGLGKDISGQAVFADLAKMPHLLVAGATGSGKSVCINTLITSILFKAKPDEVKFILIDPKMVELSVYNDVPHLMVPVVTDSRKAASVLNWAVQEMEKRYGLIAQAGVRNVAGYNKLWTEEPEKMLPSIVIIIDELADLMMVAPHDVEDAICRIAQKARAAGIYLVLATQRPSVNVITGVIKANIPSRISFAVTSQIDSRTILDASGAEKLLGKGDMLFKPQEANKPTRIQGAFVSDKEVELLVEYIKSQGHKAEANQEIIDYTNKAAEAEQEKDSEDKGAPKNKVDSLLRDAVELTLASNNASASSFQRRYHIGYSRAGRLLDTMEQLGIVGPPQGSKPREILVTEAQAFEIMDNYETR